MESNHSKFEPRFLILGFFEECENSACGFGSKGYFEGEILLALTAVPGENSQSMLHSNSTCTCAPFLYMLGSVLPRSHMTIWKGDKTEQPQSQPPHLDTYQPLLSCSPMQCWASVRIWPSGGLLIQKLGPTVLTEFPLGWRRPPVSLDHELANLPSAESTFSLILLIWCTWKQALSLISHRHGMCVIRAGAALILIMVHGSC